MKRIIFISFIILVLTSISFGQNPKEGLELNSRNTEEGVIFDKRGSLKENENIFIGMTEEDLIISWGEPQEINRSVSEDVVRKQFIYLVNMNTYKNPQYINENYVYVYIENGYIVGWQD